jgi:predicted RNA binding protein YcfA (HicA-like mRNA interferase family)
LPKLLRISGAEAVRVLERINFVKVRQTGSHVVLKKPIVADGTRIGEVVCVVPLHRELKIGTLSGVLKQAQVTAEEFIANL